MANATITGSEATFKQRAKDAGLDDDWTDVFVAAGLNTLAKLCYAVTIPGTTPSDTQVTGLLNQVRPMAVPTLADTSAIKRLIFEAQTLMVWAVKASVSGDDDASKKLAPAERRMRLEQQRRDLKGLSITGPSTGSSR